MDREEFYNIVTQLDNDEKLEIPCVVSTSRVQGEGYIIDADYHPQTLKVRLKNGDVCWVHRFGVMPIQIGDANDN